MSKRDRFVWAGAAGIAIGIVITARYYRVPVELRIPKWEALVQILPFLAMIPFVAAILWDRK